MFLIFLDLSHIRNEIEYEMTYKVKLSFIGVDPKEYPNFLRKGVIDGIGPKLWPQWARL